VKTWFAALATGALPQITSDQKLKGRASR